MHSLLSLQRGSTTLSALPLHTIFAANGNWIIAWSLSKLNSACQTRSCEHSLTSLSKMAMTDKPSPEPNRSSESLIVKHFYIGREFNLYTLRFSSVSISQSAIQYLASHCHTAPIRRPRLGRHGVRPASQLESRSLELQGMENSGHILMMGNFPEA